MTMNQIREYQNIMRIMDHLQRFIIVHSYIYYELNDNILTNAQYDRKSKELVALKNRYPEHWRRSEYFRQFGDDYNGATGFTLYHDLDPHQKKIIQSIVNCIYFKIRSK